MAKEKKEKQSILLKPFVFLGMGIIELVLLIFTNYYLNTDLSFAFQNEDKVIYIQSNILIFIFSLIIIFYGIILKIIKPNSLQRKFFVALKIFSCILIILFTFETLLIIAIWYAHYNTPPIKDPNLWTH